MISGKKLLIIGVSAAVLMMGAGVMYQGHEAGAATPGPQGAMPPPEAPFIEVNEKATQVWKEFSGRLQAVDYVELRPEVSGKIQEIRFKDGAKVEKGDILFVIDPAPYDAAVEKAKANLQSAKNQFDLAQKNSDRAQDLVKTEAISKKIFDERQSAAVVAKSQIDSTQAELKKAQIDLDHAYVKAPISGRVSRAEITIGNLVQAGGNAPVLTSIVSDKGIYADFDVDEKTYLQSIYNVARDNESQAKVPVEMILKSGGEPYKGVIQSFDNKIDPKSGTIRVRAYFENADQSLLPGMFANMRMGSTASDNLLLVPDKAVGTDQDRKFVYVIGDGNKVVYREVKLGAAVGGERAVTEGLKAGEKVIIQGIMKMRPDMVVTPKPADAPTEQPPEIKPAAK